MARSRARTALVRAVPMRAPVIRVSAPRAPSRRTRHRRHHSVGTGKVNQKTMMAAALGGAVLGYIDKTFTNIPTVPILGRAGTIAVAAYFLSGRGGLGTIARDVALAGAAVAGYELGKEGHVSGEIMGDVSRQVSGRGIHGGMAASQV